MPSVYWTLDENDILTNEYLPNSLDWTPPYPATSWYLNEDDIITADIIPRPIDWAQPYPLGKWYLDENDILKCSGIPEALIDYQGAFNKCTKLVKVTIPKTVKSIGKWSFRETLLTSVTIASDCTYYDTSFPENCVINFYPD